MQRRFLSPLRQLAGLRRYPAQPPDRYKRPPAWLFKDDVSGACSIAADQTNRHYRWAATRGPLHPIRGIRSAARAWCTFMGLVVWIAIHVKGIDGLLHYMDHAWSHDLDPNLYLYEPYGELYPAKQVVCLLGLWDEIRLPHEKPKQLFAKALRIIRLDVNPYAMSVSFPEDGKAALVAALRSFTDTSVSRRHSLVQ